MTPPKPKKYLLSSEPMTIFQSIIAFDPTQLVLEVTPDIKERVWLQISNSTSPTNRWQKYLNQVTLDTFLPWLQEEEATAKVRLDRATQTDRREVVNGTLIDLDSAKLVLIPSEAIDLSELRVPQKWIDIPELVADYYLAVQVNVDNGYIRVWGYTTYQQLKINGEFSKCDRTYSLSDEELITDLNVLWIARELATIF